MQIGKPSNLNREAEPSLTPDPQNPGWFMGWVALAHSPERFLGLFATEAEARAESDSKAGSEYFYASVRTGSDDYIRIER
jgi:beta-lactamase class D